MALDRPKSNKPFIFVGLFILTIVGGVMLARRAPRAAVTDFFTLVRAGKQSAAIQQASARFRRSAALGFPASMRPLYAEGDGGALLEKIRRSTDESLGSFSGGYIFGSACLWGSLEGPEDTDIAVKVVWEDDAWRVDALSSSTRLCKR